MKAESYSQLARPTKHTLHLPLHLATTPPYQALSSLTIAVSVVVTVRAEALTVCAAVGF
jgi:hypothetical protein